MEKKTLVIEPTWCKGCGICAQVCPAKAIAIMTQKIDHIAALFSETGLS